MCISYYLKNLNILQIYLYDINIYFGLDSGGFQIEFDNIHTLSIIHRVKHYSPIQLRLVSIMFRLN